MGQAQYFEGHRHTSKFNLPSPPIEPTGTREATSLLCFAGLPVWHVGSVKARNRRLHQQHEEGSISFVAHHRLAVLLLCDLILLHSTDRHGQRIPLQVCCRKQEHFYKCRRLARHPHPAVRADRPERPSRRAICSADEHRKPDYPGIVCSSDISPSPHHEAVRTDDNPDKSSSKQQSTLDMLKGMAARASASAGPTPTAPSMESSSDRIPRLADTQPQQDPANHTANEAAAGLPVTSNDAAALHIGKGKGKGYTAPLSASLDMPHHTPISCRAWCRAVGISTVGIHSAVHNPCSAAARARAKARAKARARTRAGGAGATRTGGGSRSDSEVGPALL